MLCDNANQKKDQMIEELHRKLRKVADTQNKQHCTRYEEIFTRYLLVTHSDAHIYNNSCAEFNNYNYEVNY